MYRFLLRIGISDFDPREVRHEAIAIELFLQAETVDVQNFIALAVQFDERVEDRVSQHACISRVRLRDAGEVVLNLDQLIFVKSAEKQHVPIRGQLADILAELLFELIVENDVVLEDEHAR